MRLATHIDVFTRRSILRPTMHIFVSGFRSRATTWFLWRSWFPSGTPAEPTSWARCLRSWHDWECLTWLKMCNEYKHLGFCALSHPLLCYLASLRGCSRCGNFFSKKEFSNGSFIRPTHCANHISRYQMLEYYSWTSQNVASRLHRSIVVVWWRAWGVRSSNRTQPIIKPYATHHCVTRLPHDCTYCLPDLVALVLADDILIIFFSPLCLFAIFIRAPCRCLDHSEFVQCHLDFYEQHSLPVSLHVANVRLFFRRPWASTNSIPMKRVRLVAC